MFTDIIKWIALSFLLPQVALADVSLLGAPSTSPSLFHLVDGDVTFTRLAFYRTYLAPEIGAKDWRGRAAVTFNLGLGQDIFWNNYVHTEGTDSKVETVGWKFELGYHLPKNVDVGYSHHSQHRMDATSPTQYGPTGQVLYRNEYELEDGYFIKLHF